MIAQAFREGLSLAEIQGACAYDPWFLAQIQDLVRTEAALRRDGLPEDRGRPARAQGRRLLRPAAGASSPA